MNRLWLLTPTVLAVGVAAGCDARPKVNLATEEIAIRQTDADWLVASSSHDLERVLPFWSDDATILAPGMSPIVGKEAIRKYVSRAFATPGFSITWKTDKVEVSQLGDLAYSSGTDHISMNNPDGKPVTDENNSVAIWKKQPDGSWKCILDVMSPSTSPNLK